MCLEIIVFWKTCQYVRWQFFKWRKKFIENGTLPSFTLFDHLFKIDWLTTKKKKVIIIWWKNNFYEHHKIENNKQKYNNSVTQTGFVIISRAEFLSIFLKRKPFFSILYFSKWFEKKKLYKSYLNFFFKY